MPRNMARISEAKMNKLQLVVMPLMLLQIVMLDIYLFWEVLFDSGYKLL